MYILCILYTIYYILFTIYYLLFTICYLLYTIYYIRLESAKSKGLFYIKKPYQGVWSSPFQFFSISWKQFYFLISFGKFDIRNIFTYQRIISDGWTYGILEYEGMLRTLLSRH